MNSLFNEIIKKVLNVKDDMKVKKLFVAVTVIEFLLLVALFIILILVR